MSQKGILDIVTFALSLGYAVIVNFGNIAEKSHKERHVNPRKMRRNNIL